MSSKSQSAVHKTATVPAARKQDVKLLLERLKRSAPRKETYKKSHIVGTLRDKFELSSKEIVGLSGYKTAQIYNLLKINDMPPKVKAYMREGVLQPTEACELSRNQPNDDAFIKTVDEFVKQKVSKNPPTFLSASITRKEQSTSGIENLNEFKKQFSKLLSQFSPKRLSASKLNVCTEMVSNMIST